MIKKSDAKSYENQLINKIGNRIRELRKAQNYRVMDLALMTKLTSSMISQVEKNGKSPSIETLIKIAGALNVKVGYFFENEQVDEEESSDNTIQSIERSN